MAFADAVALVPVALSARTVKSLGAYVTPDGTNGNKFFANKKTILHVKNTNAAPRTVTVDCPNLAHGLALADATFVVPATTGDVMWIGFDAIFHQNAADEVHITFSAVTDVTVKVIQP